MDSPNEKIIGIVGGMGPFTGLDLATKVLEQSQATGAADQPSFIMMACPGWINDRTAYLVRQSGENPGIAIADVIARIHGAGARAIGIPCNTAHAPKIWNTVIDACAALSPAPELVHMISETGRFIGEFHPDIRKVGILCTLGAYKTNVYSQSLERNRIKAINPEGLQQQEIHDLIYDPRTGIKASPTRSRHATRMKIERIAIELKNAGAQAIVLGCTELPLVIKDKFLAGLPVIDPTLALARALLRTAAPGKLRPYPHESIEASL